LQTPRPDEQAGHGFPGARDWPVILRDGKLLLYKRLKAPGSGYWNIVGGKAEQMEPAETAIRREAEEESGLVVGRIALLCATEQIINATGNTGSP
jgi:8-oxo-dGTP diphosphatase